MATNFMQNMMQEFNALAARYEGMPMEAVMSAYSRATGNPWIQNQRVKQIQSMPADYGKDAVAEAIKYPGGHEKMLRQTHRALEATAYPMFKIRKVYTDILTYRYYTAPAYLDPEDAKKVEFKREAALLDKFSDKLQPSAAAHKIAGQAIQDGKVFYTLRFRADKSHNSVDYAFLQQLPADWVKIVGFNNVSGYTVAFDLFYFLQPGTDWRQFGDLFSPYLGPFNDVLRPQKGVVFASKWGVDLSRVDRDGPGSPEAYIQNGRWAYWVTLPPEKVWTFEIDDTNAVAASPMTGLYLSMLAIAQYEQVQLELVQNPLIAVLTGEIPYRNEQGASQDDQYRLSNGSRLFFETLWYQMMAENNTSGIGLYMAPVENMKLQQLSEAPGATEISTNGYAYAVEKSGLSGLIPITDEPRAGTVNISVKLESQYCNRIYQQFEQMMEWAYSTLNLRFTWKFRMFGNIYDDEKDLDRMTKSMSLGILPDLYRYNALMRRSLLDDVSMSAAVKESGVLDMRLPLVTSYTAKNQNPNLPPGENPGGRPSIDISDVEAEGTEDMIDAE